MYRVIRPPMYIVVGLSICSVLSVPPVPVSRSGVSVCLSHLLTSLILPHACSVTGTVTEHVHVHVCTYCIPHTDHLLYPPPPPPPPHYCRHSVLHTFLSLLCHSPPGPLLEPLPDTGTDNSMYTTWMIVQPCMYIHVLLFFICSLKENHMSQ